VGRTLAGRAFAETSDSDRRHEVQFYTDDTVLLDELAALFRGSLGDGQSVATIMTSSHRWGLERRLLGQGINASEATKEGRLCMLEADLALSEFMEATGPSRERFLLQFGNILRRLQAAAAAKRRGVIVFGEMVAVLWAQQQYDVAIRLEELWNELALTCSFYLCCAYPTSAFRGLTGGPYAKICAQHSQVVSAFGAFASPPAREGAAPDRVSSSS
jgi:MEDS: MEthanogen/methylotroph, DcmR Sensory domain